MKKKYTPPGHDRCGPTAGGGGVWERIQWEGKIWAWHRTTFWLSCPHACSSIAPSLKNTESHLWESLNIPEIPSRGPESESVQIMLKVKWVHIFALIPFRYLHQHFPGRVISIFHEVEMLLKVWSFHWKKSIHWWTFTALGLMSLSNRPSCSTVVLQNRASVFWLTFVYLMNFVFVYLLLLYLLLSPNPEA